MGAESYKNKWSDIRLEIILSNVLNRTQVSEIGTSIDDYCSHTDLACCQAVVVATLFLLICQSGVKFERIRERIS